MWLWSLNTKNACYKSLSKFMETFEKDIMIKINKANCLLFEFTLSVIKVFTVQYDLNMLFMFQ